MNFPKKQYALVAAAVLVLLLVSSNCAFIRELVARDHLNKGVRDYTSKRYNEAIEHFEQAVEADPELIVGYLYMAISYRAQYIPQATSAENLEKAQKAIETFEEVLEKAPADDTEHKPTAMANLAGIYSQMGDYDKAKEWYRKRLEAEPNNPEPMYGIGTIDWQLSYDETGMTGENIEYLSEEEKEEINQLVDEGVEALKRALEIDPGYVDAMQYLNLLYREKAKLAEEEERKREWELQADRLALQALELKRKQEREAEEARRRLMAGTEKEK
ncbi:tetratricopeptide repeat protein [Acidobacteria bacterium AH-259-A15]|nr:tetratricopeptide repeat protein [Acidobacteria bacterium AH-259-A15]